MARGGYENKTHEELYAMVAGAKPEQLSSRGNALLDAGADILAIGEDLMRYLDRVEWKGEGADAFRTWSHDFAREALRLGAYATSAGEGMVNAGQGLSEVKAAMPKPTPNLFQTEPTRPPLVDQDEKSRQEAIYNVERLESYYRMANEDLSAPEEPNFKPLPDDGRLAAAPGSGSQAYAGRTSAGSSVSPGMAGPMAASSAGGANAANVSSTAATSVPASFTNSNPVSYSGVPADYSNGTTLDSAAPPIEARPQPSSSAVTPTSSSVPSGTAGPPVGPAFTGPARGTTGNVGGQGGGTSRGPVTGRPTDGTRPPRAVSTPRGSGSNGVHGGTPRPGSTAPHPSRMPRGTVVGSEQGPMGRPVTGGHPGTTGTGSSSAGGSNNGRRLANQPGGIAGVSRTPSSGRTAFTPGGTGLVRGASVAGMAPRSANSVPQENRRRDEKRPDYLTENDETWSAGRRNVVPPVIE